MEVFPVALPSALISLIFLFSHLSLNLTSAGTCPSLLTHQLHHPSHFQTPTSLENLVIEMLIQKWWVRFAVCLLLVVWVVMCYGGRSTSSDDWTTASHDLIFCPASSWLLFDPTKLPAPAMSPTELLTSCRVSHFQHTKNLIYQIYLYQNAGILLSWMFFFWYSENNFQMHLFLHFKAFFLLWWIAEIFHFHLLLNFLLSYL